jgi:hypothetical protein
LEKEDKKVEALWATLDEAISGSLVKVGAVSLRHILHFARIITSPASFTVQLYST